MMFNVLLRDNLSSDLINDSSNLEHGGLIELVRNTHGNSRKSDILRIARGQNAKIEDIPYVVRVRPAESLCTGSIIHVDWVLTAAHCVRNRQYPEDIEILAGIDDLKDVGSLGQIRAGKSVHVHDEYWEGKIAKYDVAIIMVDKSFELNERVAVLKLSNAQWPQNHEMYDRRCQAMGWGVPDIGRASTKQLKVINVTARHGARGCKCPPSFQQRRLVCLDDKGKGICKGDSGGPLVCNQEGVGVAHVIYRPEACSSFHLGKLELKCEETTGAYIYVCPMLDFISKHVPDVPPSPESCGCSRLTSTGALVLLFVLMNREV